MGISAITSLINNNVTQSGLSDRITAADVRAVLNAVNDAISKELAFTTAIPFTSAVTKIAAATVSGPLTFTKDTAGAVAGFGAILELTADGTNAPDFSDFTETNASKGWNNTAGTVNLCVFLYTGQNYLLTIVQHAGVSGGSATQLSTPTGFTATAASSSQIVLSWSDVSGESSYLIEVSDNGTSGWGTLTTKAAGSTSHTHTGLSAATTKYYRIKAVGDGTTTSDSGYATANATTSAASDTTAPTLSSAVINNATPTQIELTYSETLNSSSTPATSDYAVTVAGTSRAVSTVSVSATKVTLTLASAVAAGEAVVVTYTKGTSPIEDAAGNDAADLTSQAVTNNVEAPAAATIATTNWHTYHSPDLELTHAVVGSDDLVSAIEDQNPAHRMPNLAEPNNYRLEMATDANKPFYVASGINGHPVVEVNSTRRLPSRGSWSTQLNKPHTKIVVCQVKTIGSNVYITGGGASSGRADLGITGGKFFIYAGTILDTGVTVVADTTYIVWMEFQGDATSKCWINGTLAVTGNAGGTGTNSVTTAAVMGHVAAGAHAWVGDLFNYAGIMSEADRISITNELKTKYGVA